MPEKSPVHKTARRALFNSGMDTDGMDYLMELYRDLFDLAHESTVQADISRSLSPEEIRVRLLEGFTLADPGDILPDIKSLANAAADVAGILARHSEDAKALQKDMAGLLDEPGRFLELARTYLAEGEEMLRKELLAVKGANPEVLMFVLFNALKRSFLQIAEWYSDVDTGEWGRGYCPVCGGEPAVSYLMGEGGKRYLICFRCETHWRYRRLSCPFCQNEDPGHSGYLYSDHEDYRNLSANVCGNCSSYLKAWRIEGDDPGDSHPEIEDLKTPGFDRAIENEGYSRGAPNIYGIWLGSAGEEG